MAGIQHRDPGGEINIVVAFTSVSVAFSAVRAKKSHITPTPRGWQKVYADEIPRLLHVRYLLSKRHTPRRSRRL